MRFCIYTIGDSVNGFGHVIREITLARELRERGAEVDFMVPANTPGAKRLESTLFNVLVTNGDQDWPRLIGQAFDAILVDVENGPSREFLQMLRPHFKTIVTVCGSGYKVGNPGAVQEFSDLIIEQNPFGKDKHTSEIVETLTGMEYMMINPQYRNISGDQTGPIVVSFGGGDPFGLTQPIANRLMLGGYPLRIVIGPAAGMPHFIEGPEPEIIVAPDSLLRILDGARLLVGAFGMTAFEAAAAGVPALLTGWTGDHVHTAEFMESQGVAISLGLASHLRPEHMLPHVETLWHDDELWEDMSAAGPALVDARGVERVAERLLAL